MAVEIDSIRIRARVIEAAGNNNNVVSSSSGMLSPLLLARRYFISTLDTHTCVCIQEISVHLKTWPSYVVSFSGKIIDKLRHILSIGVKTFLLTVTHSPVLQPGAR